MFIDWCKGGFPVLPTPSLAYPHLNLKLSPVLTTYPSEKGITFESLFNRYRAIDFQDALADFIVRHNYLELSTMVFQRCADNTLLPFRRVSVFHKVKFNNPVVGDATTIDAMHI